MGRLSKGIRVGDNPQFLYQDRDDCIANTGRPERFARITINTLPEDVLLEIFDFYLDVSQWSPLVQYEDLWHTLVHVCRRWRCVVTSSPRRLNIRLLCTEKRPVKGNVWPDLPIAINAQIPKSQRSRSRGTNIIIAALKHQHNRVCEITIWNIPNSLLKEFAAIKTPFPALTHLTLHSTCDSAPVLPDSFLEGSAPRLRSLLLQGIRFPALGKLHLSSCDLAVLSLHNIPHSGYIPPDALVSSLSGLTRLQNLILSFRSPRSRALRERRAPPSLTRVVFPILSNLSFTGDSEYLEDMLSRMETPIVNVHVKIIFFNQLVFDTPLRLLRDLINRAETFEAPHRAEIYFSRYRVHFALFSNHGQAESEPLTLAISCRPSDWQLSSLAQVIGSSIPPLPTLERLELRDDHYFPQYWQDDIENAQWLEILRPFTSVKDLVLSGQLVQLVAPALGEPIGERATEELPVLQNIFVERVLPSGSLRWQKEIGQFITARQISGRPVAVHYPVNIVGGT